MSSTITQISGKPFILPVSEDLFIKSRCFTISEPISPSVAKEACQNLLDLRTKSDDPITIFINSPGGDIDSGNAIIDMIEFCQASGTPVSTVAIGMAASMASLILIAGSKGHRFCTPRSKILLHQPIVGFQGQVTDAEIICANVKAEKSNIIDFLSKRTNRSAKQIAKDIERDLILTATQALEYGAVDHIGFPAT